MTTTRFGNKTTSLRRKQFGRKLDSFACVLLYDVLLLTTAYSAYTVHFSLGQFPNMELMLLLLLPLFLTELLYFPGQYNSSVNVTLFLTGCLCALNYMSKLDHLILKACLLLLVFWYYHIYIYVWFICLKNCL